MNPLKVYGMYAKLLSHVAISIWEQTRVCDRFQSLRANSYHTPSHTLSRGADRITAKHCYSSEDCVQVCSHLVGWLDKYC